MKRRTSGNTLLVTLFFLAIAAALVGSVINYTSNTSINTDRSCRYYQAQAAADGLVDFAYKAWLKKIAANNGLITSDQCALSSSDMPPLYGYQYATGGTLKIVPLNEYGVAVTSGSAIPTPVIGSVPDYKGWYGKTYSYAATAQLIVPLLTGGTSTVGVRRLFQYTEVPVFQCMYFFQDNLELYRPAEMTISGLIHSNKKIWMLGDKTSGTSNILIQGNVSSVGGYNVALSGSTNAESPWAKFWSGYTSPSGLISPKFSNSQAAQVNQVTAIQPMGASLEDLFNDSAYSTNPNVTGGYHELIERPNTSATDPSAISTRRLYNKAGIIIHVSGTGSSTSTGALTVAVQAQGTTTLTAEAITSIQAAITKKTNTATKVVSGKTVNDALYDAREEQKVNTVVVDINALTTVLNNTSAASGSDKSVIYIYDDTSIASTTANTIFLTNGKILPDDGLTIASENPVYIQGDYNTGYNAPSTTRGNSSNTASPTGTTTSGGSTAYTRKAAAVIADAVTLLSNSWDNKNSTSVYGASNTTYNTALLSGYQASWSVGTSGTSYLEADAAKNSTGNYSGGCNNFARFLENWSGDYCTYYGSMVELFPAVTAPGNWNTTNIFSPPTRRWNFDPYFTGKTPPGTVDAVILTRGPWTKF